MTFKIHLSIKNTLSEFWAEIPKRPVARLFLCARFNGVIILREKQHGKKESDLRLRYPYLFKEYITL